MFQRTAWDAAEAAAARANTAPPAAQDSAHLRGAGWIIASMADTTTPAATYDAASARADIAQRKAANARAQKRLIP